VLLTRTLQHHLLKLAAIRTLREEGVGPKRKAGRRVEETLLMPLTLLMKAHSKQVPLMKCRRSAASQILFKSLRSKLMVMMERVWKQGEINVVTSQLTLATATSI
jgi:hypothetical protein